MLLARNDSESWIQALEHERLEATQAKEPKELGGLDNDIEWIGQSIDAVEKTGDCLIDRNW